MKTTKNLSERLAAVYKWCDNRNLNQIYNFFSVADPSLREQEARIRYILRNSTSLVVEGDEPWITSMEVTMNAVNERKQVA